MVQAPAQDTRFRVSESQARELASQFGTPLYVLDEAHLRRRIADYRAAFAAAYPDCEIAFASKANSTLAVLAIAHQEGCGIDVASEGELRAALAANVPAAACTFHGSNKSPNEIRFALEQGIGVIVVDNFPEIALLQEIGCGETRIVIRTAPGVDPLTHAKIATGQADTKFGFNIADGSAERALLACIAARFNVVGFHCHVGSQLLDPDAQRSGGEIIARLAAEMKQRHGFVTRYLNVGGGLGVRYMDSEAPLDLISYNRLVVEAILKGLAGSGLHPRLGQEPGRALVAESGVTLYRVGVVKNVPSPTRGQRTYVGVDGGLSDNPRPALYGSRYTVEQIGIGGANIETVPMTISGKHCETDTMFEDVPLPKDIAPGDLVQVLCTGAYNSSMASNYNRYPRPATAIVRVNGSFELIQRRDSWEEMFAREILPETKWAT